MTDLPSPPEPKGSDKALAIVAAFVTEFPGGATVVALLDQIFGTPYAQRNEAWLRKLYELFVELNERGVDVDSLGDRPEFVTALHDASRIALGEHLEAKLDLLKAVLFNAATHEPDPIADLWTLRYLRWIDELEPAHIAVLAFGVDPRAWLEAHGMETPTFYAGPQLSVLKLAQWPYAEDVMELMLDDLGRLQLGRPQSGVMTGGGMYDPWISARGRRFLDWLAIV